MLKVFMCMHCICNMVYDILGELTKPQLIVF